MDHRRSQILIQVLWGRDLCLPLTPSTAPARPVAGGGAALAGLPNHYKTSEKSTFRNLALQGTIMPAKSLSRPSQEAPKRPQDRLKRRQADPKRPQDHPKTAPKVVPRPRKTAPRPTKIGQDRPRAHQDRSLRLCLQLLQGRPETTPRPPQDHPKITPRPPQDHAKTDQWKSVDFSSFVYFS